MARYIDADELLGNLKRQYGEELGWQGTTNMSDVGMMIEDAPIADVAEVKHGEWREVNESENVWMCTGADGCGNEVLFLEGTPHDYEWNYCPNCGAKMDGEEEG
jgi:hypothetical protein